MPEVVWTVGWLISALKQNMCLAKQQPLRSAQRSSQGCLETPHLYLCVHIQLQLPDNIKKRGWEILLQNCWRKKCLGPTDITAAAISLLSTSGKGKAAVAWSPHMGSGGSHGCPVGCSVFTSTFIFSSGGFIIGGEFAGVFFFFPFVLPRWHISYLGLSLFLIFLIFTEKHCLSQESFIRGSIWMFCKHLKWPTGPWGRHI